MTNLHAANLSALAVLILLTLLGICLGTRHVRAIERPPECAQLEELRRQFDGVTLTSGQREFKRRAVAWYARNCRAGATFRRRGT